MLPATIAARMALDPDIVYLDHAAFSPLPKKTKWILEQLIEAKAKLGTLAPDFSIEEFIKKNMPLGRRITAELIGGSPEGVAFTRSTLQGLHTVVEGFPWKTSNNLVITDMEFTTNSYVHQVIAKKNRVDLRVVPSQNGILRFEDFERLIDEKTVLVAISLVQFSNGFRVPIKEISNLVHNMGGFLLVDGIQAVGAIPVDCKTMQIDALAAGAYKWGLGPFNTGLLWVSEELREILVPSFVGWWSTENPLRQMNHCEFVPANTAQHYEPSPTFEVLGMVESFRFLLDIGIDKIWDNIRATTDYLIKRCQETGLQVYSSVVPSHRSGIVSLGWPKMDANKVGERLRQDNIAVSPRAGAIRASPHAYNSEDDIDRFIDALLRSKKTDANRE